MSPSSLPNSRRRLVLTAVGTTALLATPAIVAGTAQVPALKSLQIVVPTPPGSQPDLLARWLAEPIARQAGVPVLVSNRPGASGAIAADAVLQAAPESGSLLLAGLDHVAYSHLNTNRRALDPFGDFVPVGSVNRDAWMVVAGASMPFDSLPALVDHARSHGPLNYATPGDGTTSHLVCARLCKALGIDAAPVPYKDAFFPDLIAGRVHFAVAPVPALVAPLAGGRLRGLATLSESRIDRFPAVPSTRELGWPDQVFVGGLFLFAPAALAPAAHRLNGWLVEAQADPAVAQRYRDSAIEPAPTSLAQTGEAIRQRLLAIDAMRVAVFGRTR